MIRNRAQREQVYSQPEYWDAKAAEFSGDSVGMWPNPHLNSLYHSEQLAWFESQLPPLAGMRVLDVGCSTGRISRDLAARGALVTGFDFSAQSIEVARRLAAGDNPRYRVQSVFDLDEPLAYDVIIVLGVLAVACRTRQDLARALARLHAALVPEGRILLVEPIHKGFMHRVLDLDLDGFLAEMRATGFQLCDLTDLHFWPSRLALAQVPWPRTLTAAGYRLGQLVMGTLPGCHLGDYKAISARRSKP